MRLPIRSGTVLLAMVGLVGLHPGGVRQSSGDDYPQWRGSRRDGSASAFVLPAQWPDTLTRQWTAEVGEGYTTPIVVGDKVYTFTRRDGHEVLTALEAETGDMVWETGYLAPYAMFSATRAHGEGPKATPLFHRNSYRLAANAMSSEQEIGP